MPLFYRTLNGAQVGDLFMSLIHTCQLCGANSFDYLIELQRHAQGTGRLSGGMDAVELSRHPGANRRRYDESHMAEKDTLRPRQGAS